MKSNRREIRSMNRNDYTASQWYFLNSRLRELKRWNDVKGEIEIINWSLYVICKNRALMAQKNR